MPPVFEESPESAERKERQVWTRWPEDGRSTRSGQARGAAGEGAAGDVPGVPERRGNGDRWAIRARLLARRGERPRPPVRGLTVLW